VKLSPTFFPIERNPYQASGSNCRNFEKLANSMLDIEKETHRIPPVRDSGFLPLELFTRHHTTQWLRPLSSPHRVTAVVPQGLCSVCMLRRPACVMDFPVCSGLRRIATAVLSLSQMLFLL